MNNKKSFKIISWVMTFFMIAVSVMGNVSVAFAEVTVATDLFISEYIEGSSNNKAIEIFNGTGNDVNLSEYKLELYGYGASTVPIVGSTTPTSSYTLTGVLKNGEVYVIANPSAIQTIKDKSQITQSVISFNGNDPVVLKHNDIVIDCVGKVGENPGPSWGTGIYTTVDHTLVRKSTITTGDSITGDNYDPSVEWTSYPKDTIADLGTHTMGEAGEPAEPVVLTALTLPQTLQLEEAKTSKLSATYAPTNTTEKDVVWASTNETIATVAQDGTVTGIAVGQTTITVTSKLHNDIKAECIVAVVKAVPVELVTITEARTKKDGDVIKTKGTVSRISGDNIFIQDTVAGICIYKKGLILKEGDSVEVIGVFKNYSGLIELIDSADVKVSATVLSSGNMITPKVVKINEINEALESQLVKVEKAKLGAINPTGDTPLTDSTGTLKIRKIPALTGIVEGDTVDAICVVGEYNSVYQLNVTKAVDVTKIDLGPDTTKPVIDHTPITEANKNLDLSATAKVTDDRNIASVKIYYRTKGQVEFKVADMVNTLGNCIVTITKENLDILGFQYYIEASDGVNTEKTETYDVTVIDTDIAGPTITKVEPVDGAILETTNTKPGIRVEFNDASSIDTASVKLAVDGVDITSSATVKTDSVSYAMDTELSQGKHSITVNVSDTIGNKTTKTWSFTIGKVEYNTYFGELHSHTNISDGTGSLEDAYSWAKDNAKADFFAVTDHSNWFDNENKGSFFNLDGTENDSSISTEWKGMHDTADKYNEDGKFVAIAGFEMTWSGSTGGWGHINTFNTKGFESRTNAKMNLQTYYGEIAKMPNSISQLNHPGKTFGDFGDFGFYTPAADNVVNLIEVGNGEGPVRGSGYFPSYEYYTRALDKGWHVAPTNNEDNHKSKWTSANTARTVVLAPTLTRDSIYEAMSNRRVYSTEDENLEIMYKANGQVMGSSLKNPETLNLVIDLKDPDATDKIGKVSIIANGGTVVESKVFDSNTASWELQLAPEYDYYYVRVDQVDKDIAVTAPVWTGEVTPVGISKVEVSQNPQIVKMPVDVTASVYNNGSSALSNVKVEFFKNEVKPENIIGEQNIASIAAASEQNAKISWTPNERGTFTIIAQATITIDGKVVMFTEKTTIDVEDAEDLIKVVIDGGHQNQYVSGDNVGKMQNLKALLKENKVMLVENKDELTSQDLENTKVLMITDPQSANKDPLTASKFTTQEIQVIKSFVDGGGSLIITSRADYNDKGVTDKTYQSSNQGNAILEAIGTNLRFNDDELIDDAKNGGQNFRLYFDKYISSKYKLASNIPNGQTYSAYSGCSVILKENGNDEAVDWIVKGHATTATLDSDLQNDNIVVAMGNVYSLAAEKLAGGGKVVVSGTTFFSDFETASGDEAYSNRTITENIINWMTIPQKSIAEVRVDANKDGVPDLFGKKFTIEGIVTAQSEAVTPKNSFFEVIYVQDATGGITVFGVSSTAVKLGQKVRITGYVDGYQGDAEIAIANETKDLLIIDEAINIVEPKLLSTKVSMLEETEGLLVKIEGMVTKIVGQNIYVNDGTGETRAYVEGYIGDNNGEHQGLWDASIKVGDFISVVGLASEDPEGHRLRVRNTSEIIKLAQPAITTEKISPETEFAVGGDAKVVIRATNNSPEAKEVTLIVALFGKDGKFINYVAVSQIIGVGKVVDLSGTIRVLAEGTVIKCFVWDTLEGMNPLSNVIILPVK